MSPPKRTQAQRRAETERRVLDAAIDLIARHGSHAVSLAQVGAAAGYSRGIVTHNFGSREKLLDAVLRDAQTFHVPDNAKDGLEWLAAAICAYLENIAKRAPVTKAFLQMWGEAIAGDPVLKPRFAKLDAQFREFLAQRVRDGMGDESIRSDVDPTAAAVFLVAVLRGTGMQLIATPSLRNDKAIIDEAEQLTRRALQSGRACRP